MMNFSIALVYVLARLKEPTTWLAFSVGSAAVATTLQSNAGLVAALLSGLVAALTAETK